MDKCRPDRHRAVASAELLNTLSTSGQFFHEAEDVPQVRLIMQRELRQISHDLPADLLGTVQQSLRRRAKVRERRAVGSCVRKLFQPFKELRLLERVGMSSLV